MEEKKIKNMSVEEIITQVEKSKLYSKVQNLRDCVGLIIIILCFMAITLICMMNIVFQKCL